MKNRQNHNIEPVFDENSKILILGSFPSVKSRESEFFYGHPQNRFWRVVSRVCGENCPVTIPEKRDFLISNHIAVWDVIKSCDIEGSSDSSISSVTANDIKFILRNADIKAIFVNGGTASRLYKKHCEIETGVPAVTLPSTSPANARFSIDMLVDKWRVIHDFL